MKAISISDLKKVYSNGTEALKSIQLDVASGDFFALLGANGAGKTTIIGILTGLVNKTSGKVKVYEYDLDHMAVEARKIMGVVPQEMNFNVFEKAQDVLINSAGYFGMSRRMAKIESEKLLRDFDLWEKRSTQSRNLSGGMKRRLMIARALMTNPKLLILDEPTAGVDVELRHAMWQSLKELNQRGTTILLTTHYLEEVEQLCSKAAIIKEGEIIANDEVKKLIRLLDEETYVIHVDEVKSIESLHVFEPKVVDGHTLEVCVKKETKLKDLLRQIDHLDMELLDIRPKGNRIENLFLNILSK